MSPTPPLSAIAPPAGSTVSPAGGEALPRWKRTVDIACSLAAFPLFALCMLYAAILTAIASPGPILFCQERIGYRGRRFKLYKFRTMHVGADAGAHQAHFAALVRGNGPMVKLDGRGDARLIPGGRFLRASGLDELPQLINVLRGEMSLVGPRPCIPYEYAGYTTAQHERFETVPGLTGLWQVSGKNHTTFEEMVRLDVRYVRTRSPALDFRIMLRTVPALCAQVAEMRHARRNAHQAGDGAAKQSEPGTVSEPVAGTGGGGVAGSLCAEPRS